jgi:chaperone modulatory protein CbpM
MAKNELTIITVETDPELTLEEVCDVYHVTPAWLADLMAYGVIEPHHARFDTKTLYRIRRLLRLQHDLELNMAGAALALDLIEQIETLQIQVELFEKYLTILR